MNSQATEMATTAVDAIVTATKSSSGSAADVHAAAVANASRAIIAVVQPYLASLETRLAALEAAQQATTTTTK